MKFLTKAKDGGPDSPVDGYFLIEIKGLFSIAFLKFNKGTRETYHNHAFNALTWFISGDMVEEDVNEFDILTYKRSFLPKFTPKSKMHRVKANKDSWCFTLRGPWSRTWEEYDKKKDLTTVLTHGRIPLSTYKGNY